MCIRDRYSGNVINEATENKVSNGVKIRDDFNGQRITNNIDGGSSANKVVVEKVSENNDNIIKNGVLESNR